MSVALNVYGMKDFTITGTQAGGHGHGGPGFDDGPADGPADAPDGDDV